MFWNEKRRKRIYNGDKDNLPKRLGDYSFSLSVAGAIALFAEYVIKGGENVSANIIYLCVAIVFGLLVIGIVFYKKGGL